MLRRIVLENFMSHVRTEIDLADGLTVLTGPNNCGKSAIVAALMILSGNDKSTYVTRHGKKLCRVTAETDAGDVIVWQRKNNRSVSYTINGEEIHRLKQGQVPDQLHDLLRMPRVQVEAGKASIPYDVHFGEQKEPIFLLSDGGSRAAAFFASSSDAAHLLEMQSLHRSRVQEARKDERRLAKEAEVLADELGKFAPLQGTEELLKQAESQWRQIESTARSVVDLSALLRRIQLQQQRANRDQKIALALRRLKFPEPVEPADELAALLDQLTSQAERRRQASVTCSVLEPLRGPEPPEPVQELHLLITAQQRHHQKRLAAEGKLKTLSILAPVPTLLPTGDLETLLRSLQDADRKQQRSLCSVLALGDLRDVPEQEPVTEIETSIRQLINHELRVTNDRQQADVLEELTVVPEENSTEESEAILRRLNEQLILIEKMKTAADESQKAAAVADAELQRFVRESPACPTCGRPWNGVGAAHDHRHDNAPSGGDIAGMGGAS